MNKRIRHNLSAFQAAQHSRYHISQYSPHEQAIREHMRRGHAEGLERVAGLLDQRNRIK